MHADLSQLGLLFQIIELAGPVPWPKLELPEGRTQKACVVMVDKEKAKVRKAKEAAAAGEDVEVAETPTTKSKVRPFNLSKEIGKLADPLLAQKRGAAADEEGTPTAKKPKATPRKSKKTLKAEADAEAAGEDDDEVVKAEVIE